MVLLLQELRGVDGRGRWEAALGRVALEVARLKGAVATLGEDCTAAAGTLAYYRNTVPMLTFH